MNEQLITKCPNTRYNVLQVTLTWIDYCIENRWTGLLCFDSNFLIRWMCRIGTCYSFRNRSITGIGRNVHTFETIHTTQSLSFYRFLALTNKHWHTFFNLKPLRTENAIFKIFLKECEKSVDKMIYPTFLFSLAEYILVTLLTYSDGR